MEMPKNWQPPTNNAEDETCVVDGQVIGNDKNGRKVAVHSLAVVPEYQGKGIGRALMNEYIRYISGFSASVDGVVIIAHGHLIRFYESCGFENLGPSPCAFGGGGWYDMVRLFCFRSIYEYLLTITRFLGFNHIKMLHCLAHLSRMSHGLCTMNNVPIRNMLFYT